jgi:tRNA G18 (ribose-2'-O)-methylase SpoU
VFARPPARGAPEGHTIGLDRSAEVALEELELEPPVVLCLGAEREGLSTVPPSTVHSRARIPMRPDGPDSLNVAMAAAVGLWIARNRMRGHA